MKKANTDTVIGIIPAFKLRDALDSDTNSLARLLKVQTSYESNIPNTKQILSALIEQIEFRDASIVNILGIDIPSSEELEEIKFRDRFKEGKIDIEFDPSSYLKEETMEGGKYNGE